jgi:hypothetical protein
VVDENGRIIWGDELMILLSRSILVQTIPVQRSSPSEVLAKSF